jgi:hypothetical protein
VVTVEWTTPDSTPGVSLGGFGRSSTGEMQLIEKETLISIFNATNLGSYFGK